VSDVGPGRARQGAIYRDGVLGRRAKVPASFPELERRARRAMSREAFAYVAGSAGDESTGRANRAAFDRWRIVPRVLRGQQTRDLRVELFGQRLPAPLLLAPVGVLEMAHPDADLAAARGAAVCGLPFVQSSQASRSMEQVAAVSGSAPRWFQLYASAVDELSDSFVARAEASGCQAVVLTVDTTVLGWRPRDLDLGYLPFARGKGIAQYVTDPVFQRLVDERLAGPTSPRPPVTAGAVRTLLELSRSYPGRTTTNLRAPRARAAVETFLDLERLRAKTPLPLLVKGLSHPDDARRAVECGADGVIVSNHGGRQVDGALASTDALPAVRAAVDVPVLVDSGVRTGADVVKALCLGADAVLVGRPYVYGLALDGAAGVTAVLQNLIAELDLTLALVGASAVADLSTDLLAASP
jgi:isopentenyl diphosphate isomerase/L-lactate dehydrogenase-like FMN-dependent dehydrogenase